MSDSISDRNISGFAQCPNILLYGLPQIPVADKWALIALMGLCWDRGQKGKSLKELEGPYQLSLRQMGAIVGVDHTSLRSREGKAPREGILDRLQTIGYVTVVDAQPVNDITGEKERAQTHLYIHLEKIWSDNAAFMEQWVMPIVKLANDDVIVLEEKHEMPSVMIPSRIAKNPRKIIGRIQKDKVQQSPETTVSNPQRLSTTGKQSRTQELQTMPYAEYLQTAEWAAKRAKALRFAGYKCQLCNSSESLNVHHRTYERRGHELMGDLTVLCNDCHVTFTYNRDLAE